MKKPQVILVTGASSGIGAATTLRLLRAGHRVIGASRSGGTPSNISSIGSRGQFLARRLDLQDYSTIETLLAEIRSEMGRLDTVVNSAGIALAGPLEKMPLESLRRQFETNLMGTAYLIRAAISLLRASAPSRFIQISSIAAHVALPFQSAYCAAKAGVDSLCESLRYEVEPLGVRLIMVEPGSTRTDLTQRRETIIGEALYATAARKALTQNDSDERNGIHAEKVAKVVEHALMTKWPHDRYSVGLLEERLTLYLQKVIPAPWFRRIIAAHYRL